MRLLMTILWLGVAQAVPAQEGPHLAVSGAGQVTRAPDRADLRLGVTAEAPEAEDAAAALSDRIGPVIDALRAADVAAEDIQTGTLALSPIYDDREGPGEDRQIAAYRAESVLAVEIDRLDEIGRIVGDAIASGANRIDGIGFSLADPEAAEDAALREAVADAARKAALVAEAAGRALGPVLSLVEEGGAGPGPMMRMEAVSSAADMVVAPGEIEVTAGVRATFALSDP